ncbi:MAG: inositol monophosphatase [Chloroflexi bacterium]|nr:inositol monophosphatase [Chloroflexota bacterium]
MQMRDETRAALAAVDAGLKLMRRRAGADQITSKGGRDLVTATDVAVEDAVRASLLSVYPEWTVVGEERGGEDQIGDRPYWLVDPICGTRNFASDIPMYACNVALVKDGQLLVAAVGDGGTGERYIAEQGSGAYIVKRNGPYPIHASADSLILSFSAGTSKKGMRPDIGADFTYAAIKADKWDLRMLSTTLSMAYVASGRLAAYLLFEISSPVHIAAGALLCQEAGAVVTSAFGEPWTVAHNSILSAATPELHAEISSVVAATVK